jgi:hypothetical protein
MRIFLEQIEQNLVNIGGQFLLTVHLQEKLPKLSYSGKVGSGYPRLAMDLSEAILLRFAKTMDIKPPLLAYCLHVTSQWQMRRA